MTYESELNLTGLRSKLQTKRYDLEKLMADHGEDSRPVELDQTRVGRLSRMDAMQDQEMAREKQRRRLVELERIEAALRRIAEGDYGYCVKCGDEIATKRLDLDPTASTCIDCAHQAERTH